MYDGVTKQESSKDGQSRQDISDEMDGWTDAKRQHSQTKRPQQSLSQLGPWTGECHCPTLWSSLQRAVRGTVEGAEVEVTLVSIDQHHQIRCLCMAAS